MLEGYLFSSRASSRIATGPENGGGRVKKESEIERDRRG